MLSLGCGAILPVVLSTMIALVCAVALSTCFESVIFALFARPYDVGDVIVLVGPMFACSIHKIARSEMAQHSLWLLLLELLGRLLACSIRAGLEGRRGWHMEYQSNTRWHEHWHNSTFQR